MGKREELFYEPPGPLPSRDAACTGMNGWKFIM